ncbi:MAG: GNAT family N-acetyltransferase [Clostridia bacterium]|nr:GNAT family N-acetyltransferase [Clostridia bacterium]
MLMLKLPTMADMPFRAAMMADPDTMAYNAPWFPPDGTIPFPEEKWADWLANWATPSAERFYAFLINEKGEMVGECNWAEYGESMSVVVKAEYRGRGYGYQGLMLLCEQAFRYPEIDALWNCFEPEREPALATFQRAGFVPVKLDGEGFLRIRLTRERWQMLRRQEQVQEVFRAMCDWDAGNAHRIHHFAKVHDFARQIGLSCGLNENAMFILEIAALVHDIGIKPADAQYGRHDGPLQEQMGEAAAQIMLDAMNLPPAVVRRVSFLVGHHHTTQGVAGEDWQILLEADFLVNMAESSYSDEAVDRAEETLFRTAEGKRLLRCIRAK